MQFKNPARNTFSQKNWQPTSNEETEEDRKAHTPHFQKLRKDFFKIMSWTRPSFYSKIDNVTYVIVKLLKYVIRKFSHHMHTVSKCLYEEIFIENITKFAARY